MLVLNPRRVWLDGKRIESVSVIVVDRKGQKVVLEWSDFGPYAVMGDIVEQRVTIRLVHGLDEDALDEPKPGDEMLLEFYVSNGTSEAQRSKASARVVVTEVRHELSQAKGALRTIVMEAIDAFDNASSSGANDPIVIVNDAGAGVGV